VHYEEKIIKITNAVEDIVVKIALKVHTWGFFNNKKDIFTLPDGLQV
jgi:hypothetical protein